MNIVEIQVTPINPQRWGDDLDVVNAARVSFNKESKKEQYEWIDPPSGETVESAHAKGWPVRHVAMERISAGDVKLINYLAKHKHFSPFNHSFLSFRIKAPIFVARQLVKHKFMPWNEVSRRYVDDEPEFYFPEMWRGRATNTKQGSSDKKATELEITKYIKEDVQYLLSRYQNLLALNVAPEQARMVLPQSMMTEWIWSGTLGAFLDMLVLRLDPHTQKESRDVAWLIAGHVKGYFPVSFNARIDQ